MTTEAHSIDYVLLKTSSFYIPPFQRPYAWGRAEIERYFNDIIRIIDSELDENQKDKLEHFFGTLVIKREIKGMYDEIYIVVDGQQRLTTSLLFLTALRDLETDEKAKNLITNRLKHDDSPFQDNITLKQVTKDWDSYKALVNGTEAASGIIKNAYTIFRKLIEEKRHDRPEIKTNHYIIALKRMNVAQIVLDERPYKGEDPQIIFETLNSLGKPLTLSDLIRNFVLLNMDSENQSDVYEHIWYPEIERQLEDNASSFFRDFLQYKKHASIKAISDNNTKEIYAACKDFVGTAYASHKDFIDDIVPYVRLYKWIIDEENSDKISNDKTADSEIKELLRNIFHDIKTEAFKPFVLGLLHYYKHEAKISDSEIIALLKTIRTYLIRRRITKLTQGENKSIVLLCDKIADIADGKEDLTKMLSSLFYKMRFPNDDEIRKVFLTANFYEDFKNYRKFILGKIEEHNSPKSAIDFRKQVLTIEHIMPQSLSEEWKNALGENFETIQKNYLHNIGNLILTEFNSEMGNKPFAKKIEKLNESSLFYRLDIVKCEKWDESAIKEHQEKMISWFLDTFPIPDEYKHTDNWTSKEAEITTFSPLNEEIKEILEEIQSRKRKPLKITIGGNEIQTAHWQDVFLQFVKYIHDSGLYDFDFLINNQREIFSSDYDIILQWKALKPIVSADKKFAVRYKTLSGEFCSKVKNLSAETLFVHTNISASACISRIAKLMERFTISNDFVEITLK